VDTPLAELFDCLHKTPSYVDNGFPMVRVTDIKPGALNLSNTRKVDEKTFKEFSKKYTPKMGDIVFSRVGSYGVSSIVNTNEPFCLGQNTIFIIPNVNSYLFYYFLNSPNAKVQIDEFVEGTTQPTISMKSIREIKVSVPPISDQQQIIAKISHVNSETHRLESLYQQKLTALESLKKSLLNQAFNGDL
jgi:type I restriction enzyme S subunit